MYIARSGNQPGGNLVSPLTTWLETLDRLGLPLLLIGLDGREIHATVTLRTILIQEPARIRVLTAAKQIALAQLDHSQPSRGGGAIPDPYRHPFETIRVPGALYTVRVATIELPASVVLAPAGQPAALVAVERRRSVCPSVERLIERFRLTPREAEVALLLAQRKCNIEVAETLAISVHTARHHTQRILEKLHIQRRADVMRLMFEDID